jgi:hypothetical protein
LEQWAPLDRPGAFDHPRLHYRENSRIRER